MHLLYFRFYHRVLQDLGFLPKEVGREPVLNLLNQGIVYKDGAKMSKSKGNVVSPDALIEKYGADTMRLFSLFAAPAEKVLEWNDQGVEGSYRFLGRVWRMVQNNLSLISGVAAYSGKQESITNPDAKKLRTKTHQTIQKVTNDLGNHSFQFNTAISAMMELVNEIYGFKVEATDSTGRAVLREAVEVTVQLLCPLAPHICEELWQQLAPKTSSKTLDLLTVHPWPKWDEQAVSLDTVTVVVQVNGKLRANLVVPKAIPDKELESLAAKEAHVVPHLSGKQIVKTIVIPHKLVNFVVKP
jgi:leucyl-tRNA synthetase